MEEITLSIVIGTYNRIDILRRCLEALMGSIKAGHEIIVVDAGSTDGTREFLKMLDGIRPVFDGELLGQAKSLNRIFRTLDSEYVCWLSDDNIVQSGALDEVVNILKKNCDIGLVGLKVRDVTGVHVGRPYLGGIWPSGILNCNQGVMPTFLLKKIGGFDEEFRDYGIDGDLTTRVLLEGYKVVLTRRIAVHHYRDHATVNWTDNRGREDRMRKARDLYGRKFRALVEMVDGGGKYDRDQRLSSKGLYRITRLYDLVQKTGLSMEKWMKVGPWDWRNLYLARFISRLDFALNYFRPYYLVQRIPSQVLNRLKAVNQYE
jgi:GT2 family glycosyltransferase